MQTADLLPPKPTEILLTAKESKAKPFRSNKAGEHFEKSKAVSSSSAVLSFCNRFNCASCQAMNSSDVVDMNNIGRTWSTPHDERAAHFRHDRIACNLSIQAMVLLNRTEFNPLTLQ